MMRVLLITRDEGLEASFGAMAAAAANLFLSTADAEEAIAAAGAAAPDVILVDADTTSEAAELAGALALLQPSPVALLTERLPPEGDPLWQCGADGVAVKPGGPSGPRLAGADGPAFVGWLAELAAAAQ